jgi:hypothetical protein
MSTGAGPGVLLRLALYPRDSHGATARRFHSGTRGSEPHAHPTRPGPQAADHTPPHCCAWRCWQWPTCPGPRWSSFRRGPRSLGAHWARRRLWCLGPFVRARRVVCGLWVPAAAPPRWRGLSSGWATLSGFIRPARAHHLAQPREPTGQCFLFDRHAVVSVVLPLTSHCTEIGMCSSTRVCARVITTKASLSSQWLLVLPGLHLHDSSRGHLRPRPSPV